MPHPLGLGATQVSGVLDIDTEARRTHLRAVAAGQTTRPDLLPVGMVEVTIEQLLQTIRLQMPTHVGRRLLDRIRCCLEFLFTCRVMRQAAEKVSAGVGANINHEVMPLTIQDFRQRQIKPFRCPGAGIHRPAETGAAGASTVDGNDKEILPLIAI